MIRLTVLAGPDAGAVFTRASDTVVIGRSRTCHIILHDAYISKRHCTITRQGNHFILTDLNTKSGTFLNDPQNRLTAAQTLEEVSEVFLGSATHLRIELLPFREAKDETVVDQSQLRRAGDETLVDPLQQDRLSSPATVAPSAQPRAARSESVKAVRPSTVPLVISVVSGPDQGKVYTPSKEAFTIGRSETCDLVLHDPWASRVHATIEREGDGYSLHDENTRNGTFLQSPSARVFHADLSDGDLIYIGQTRLRVEIPSRSSATDIPTDATLVSTMVGGKKVVFTLTSPLRSAHRTRTYAFPSEMLSDDRKSETSTSEEQSRPQREEQLQPSVPGKSDVWITLRVIQGNDAGAVFSPPPRAQSFTVGRGQKADFRLSEANASREHFSITRTATGCILRDSSLNGTFLNNATERITQVTLQHGDEIRVINTVLKVELPLAEEATVIIAPPTSSPSPPSGAPHPAEAQASAPQGRPQAEDIQSESAAFKQRLAKIQKQKGVNLRPFIMPGTVRHWASLLLMLIGVVSSYGFLLAGHPVSFSGGDLVKGHAKWQNDCTTCHTPWGLQAVDDACVTCHIKPETKGREYFRLTPTLARNECVSCHTEHRGQDFDIVGRQENGAGAPGRGVHLNLIGFKGENATFCWKCHGEGIQTRRFQDRPIEEYYRKVFLTAETAPSASGRVVNPLKPLPSSSTPVSREAWLRSHQAKETGLRYGHTKHDLDIAKANQDKLACTACHLRTSEETPPRPAAALIEGDIAFPGHAQCIDCHKDWLVDRDPQAAVKFKASGECKRCHTSEDGGVTRVRSRIQYVNFSHESHTRESSACEQCHRIVLTETQYLPVLRSTEAYPVSMNTCYQCHAEEKQRHPQATLDCLGCHGVHHTYASVTPLAASWARKLTFDNVLLMLGVIVVGLSAYTYVDARLVRQWLAKADAPLVEEEAAVVAPTAAAGEIFAFPQINELTCIGCGNCWRNCPTEVLAPREEPKSKHGHVSSVVNPDRCKARGGCHICQDKCPTTPVSIRVTQGPVKKEIECAKMDEHYESNVPGLFLAGDVTGRAGLIKKAINQGDTVARYIADRKPRNADAPYDVIIIGAGPAGLCAALEAQRKKLRYLLFERSTVASTIQDFPRDKPSLGEPVLLSQYGLLHMPDVIQKEALIAMWEQIIREKELQVNEREEVLEVKKGERFFSVTTTKGSYESAYVILAIGNRGNPRKLGVPGEEPPRVTYSLSDPAEFQGKRVLVVGGGDSAIEAAVALAKQPGTTVTLSYRQEKFAQNRVKLPNLEAIAAQEKEGRVTVLFNSVVTDITDHTVTL
ncbi:MAG TPA: FHA domain-containing protein, partial [Methylomirabilota bacterium]|nr:FHA domain-containing protein [Methylomirabilota bacterium]